MDDVRTALSEGRIDQPRTRTGEVRVGDRPSLPYVVVDADGTEIEAISKYLRTPARQSPVFQVNFHRRWLSLAVA